jgi:hypothetical protein
LCFYSFQIKALQWFFIFISTTYIIKFFIYLCF